MPHDAFPIEPTFCPVDYTLSTTDLFNELGQLTSAVSYADLNFSIYYAQDLLPVYQSHTVTLTGTSTSKYGTVNT